MVSYRVRRLPADDDPSRRYHLYDRADQLLLVADQGSAWLPSDQPPQVRFARPDGERVASMDLPRPEERRADKKQNYAVIYEHAVYALITATETHNGATGPLSPGPRPFSQLMIEVEGNKWPALRWPGEDGPLLTLYEAEDGLSTPLNPDSTDLPEPIGLIEVGAGDFNFELTLPSGRLVQGPLLGLALVYLVDSAG